MYFSIDLAILEKAIRSPLVIHPPVASPHINISVVNYFLPEQWISQFRAVCLIDYFLSLSQSVESNKGRKQSAKYSQCSDTKIC